MKVRIITGLLAAALPIAALWFLMSPLLGILIIPFAAMACYEICHAVKMENRAMIGVATVAAAFVPPLLEYGHRLPGWLGIEVPAYPLLLGYFLLLVILMLAQFGKTRFDHVLYALLASLAVPGAASALLLIRNLVADREGPAFEMNLAVFLVFYTFCSAWLTDIFAYFVGSKLGKHKLSPKISPKKTVEGAIGGLIGAALMNMGFAILFNTFFLENHKLNLLAVALLTVPIGAISMLGDLAASVLKRNFGVKDFGKLFPGHGGVMDRIDSLVVVAPTVLAILKVEEALGILVFYK